MCSYKFSLPIHDASFRYIRYYKRLAELQGRGGETVGQVHCSLNHCKSEEEEKVK